MQRGVSDDASNPRRGLFITVHVEEFSSPWRQPGSFLYNVDSANHIAMAVVHSELC